MTAPAVIRYKDLRAWCSQECWVTEGEEADAKERTLRDFLNSGVWIERPVKRRKKENENVG